MKWWNKKVRELFYDRLIYLCVIVAFFIAFLMTWVIQILEWLIWYLLRFFFLFACTRFCQCWRYAKTLKISVSSGLVLLFYINKIHKCIISWDMYQLSMRFYKVHFSLSLCKTPNQISSTIIFFVNIKTSFNYLYFPIWGDICKLAFIVTTIFHFELAQTVLAKLIQNSKLLRQWMLIFT